jgi:serine protease
MALAYQAGAFEPPQLVKPVRAVAKPVVVAVVDSGSPGGNPDLQTLMLPGLNLARAAITKTAACPESVNGFDPGAHGDQVARLIAAHSAPYESGSVVHANILPIYVYGKCKVSRADMMTAVKWAAGLPVSGFATNTNPARVINLSLSGGGIRCGADLQQVVNELLSMNIYVVAAAGNSAHQRLREPGNCEGVLAVGASEEEGRIADYSAVDERITV